MKFIRRLLFLLILLGAAGYYSYSALIPDATLLKTKYPHVQHDAVTKKAKVTLQDSRPKTWTSVKSVSKAALGAIIVSEDWAFFQHKGYDPNQIQIAIESSWKKGHLGRGASTITQQVAKNVFLSNERSLIRKAIELYLAIKIEETISKWKILELYINIAELGPGIYGIGPASHYYFSKRPSELNAKEGAFLAMLLPSPVRYSQSFREKHLTNFAQRSVESILDKMVQAQYLTTQDRETLRGVSLSFESIPEQETNEEALTEKSELQPEEQSRNEQSAANPPPPSDLSPPNEENPSASDLPAAEEAEPKNPSAI